uniref:Uncharacterized protein n=1 Tax=Biomphalaria glabrata TaxID=6526 RepID=A0A2C9KW93_BIOGL
MKMPKSRKIYSRSITKHLENLDIYKSLIEQYNDIPLPGSGETNKLCLKGHVLLIYLQNERSPTATAKVISSCFGFPLSKRLISLVHKLNLNTLVKYKTTLNKNSKSILDICSQIFYRLPSETVLNPSLALTSVTETPHSITETSLSTTVTSLSTTETPLSTTVTSLSTTALPLSPTNPKTCLTVRSNDDLTPRKICLKRRLSVLSQARKEEKSKYRKTISELNLKSLSQPSLIKNLKQTVA